jgi:DNA-binding transcriptional MerR regulator
MQINELANKTGVSIRTIRYYTQIGLLPEVEKNGKSKDYPEEMINTIKKIKELQSKYIPLNKIKEILENKEEIIDEKLNNSDKQEINIRETIPASPAMIYKLNNDITILVSNGKRLSQEKLNDIKKLL